MWCMYVTMVCVLGMCVHDCLLWLLLCVCALLVGWWCFLQTASLVDELLGEFNAWKEDLPKIDALKDSLDSLRSEVG